MKFIVVCMLVAANLFVLQVASSAETHAPIPIGAEQMKPDTVLRLPAPAPRLLLTGRVDYPTAVGSDAPQARPPIAAQTLDLRARRPIMPAPRFPENVDAAPGMILTLLDWVGVRWQASRGQERWNKLLGPDDRGVLVFQPRYENSDTGVSAHGPFEDVGVGGSLDEVVETLVRAQLDGRLALFPQNDPGRRDGPYVWLRRERDGSFHPQVDWRPPAQLHQAVATRILTQEAEREAAAAVRDALRLLADVDRMTPRGLDPATAESLRSRLSDTTQHVAARVRDTDDLRRLVRASAVLGQQEAARFRSSPGASGGLPGGFSSGIPDGFSNSTSSGYSGRGSTHFSGGASDASHCQAIMCVEHRLQVAPR